MRIRKWFTLVLALSVMVAATAVGDGAATGKKNGARLADPPFLVAANTIGSPTAIVLNVAASAGYFAAANIELVEGTGTAAALAGIIGGNYDLTIAGVLTPMQIAAQGKPVSIVYGATDFGSLETLVADSQFKTFDDLKKANPCVITTFTPGTSAYGWTNYLITKGGLSNCTISPIGTAPAQIAALAGGQVQARFGTWKDSKPLVDQGRANRLIYTLNGKDGAKYFNQTVRWPELIIYGLADHVKAKRPQVLAFITAMNKAYKYVSTHTPAEIATMVLAGNKPLADLTTVATYTQDVTDILPITAPDAGYISRNAWAAALKGIDNYGSPGWNRLDPLYSYDHVIDMSYYDATVGRPFTAVMSAANEIPAPTGVSKKASGTFSATITETSSGATLTWGLSFTGLSDKTITAAIYHGRKGVRGPVLARLCSKCATGKHGVVKIPSKTYTLLTNGKGYVEFSTSKQPKGAIRGQIYVG